MNHVSSSFMQSAILNSTKGNCALSDAIHVSLTNFGNVRKVYFLIVYKKKLGERRETIFQLHMNTFILLN